MEFIIDNYIWFLVGGIVLIMTLIGYIADKTNYIEKQKERDIKAKEQNEIKKKNHLTYGKKAFMKEIGKGENLVLEESLLTYPVEFDREIEEIVIPNNEEVNENVEDLLNQDLADIPVEESTDMEPTELDETVSESLEAPISEDLEEPIMTEEPVSEEVAEDVVLTPEEITQDQNEEDIWNF